MSDLFRFFKRSQGENEPAGDRADEPSDDRTTRLKTIRAYHAATCHHFYRYAHGPGDLDWDTQPDPFRRYRGAPLVALDHHPVGEGDDGPRYADLFGGGSVESERVGRDTVSQLFYDSLALSAWKQYQESRWALRVNPSSGNLHPTEGYLLCGPIEGLCTVPMLAHYAPREHALEVRAEVPSAAWDELARDLPPGTFFVGLASIHWREAWKYGERAYRYCQHDCGHAIACIDIAAAALGWRVRLCDDLGHLDLERLLGVRDPRNAEREEPDCLLAVIPDACELSGLGLPAAAPTAFADIVLAGDPNELSPDHVEWSAIDVAAEMSRKPRTKDVYAAELEVPEALAMPSRSARSARQIVHQRRSAVAFDGETMIERDDFYRVLADTLRGPARVLPWAPRVHLALFVHRVRGLEPGLYFLARDPAQTPLLKAAMQKPFMWEKPEGCPEDIELSLLAKGDARAVARSVSCNQSIASDGCFALSMLAEFDPALERYGAWFYPRLFWECGAVGQVLYLEAEALGIRGTGIGCFFDEPAHAVFGLSTLRYRSLYHFTLGGPVVDTRLQTWPPYPPRDEEPIPGHFTAP
jgi:SagB-type dehydrogenase family enzyme